MLLTKGMGNLQFASNLKKFLQFFYFITLLYPHETGIEKNKGGVTVCYKIFIFNFYALVLKNFVDNDEMNNR